MSCGMQNLVQYASSLYAAIPLRGCRLDSIIRYGLDVNRENDI